MLEEKLKRFAELNAEFLKQKMDRLDIKLGRMAVQDTSLINTIPLNVKRIAYRENEQAQWQWFSDPVVYTPQGYPFWENEARKLETSCELAVTQYTISNVRILEGPSIDALERHDLNEESIK